MLRDIETYPPEMPTKAEYVALLVVQAKMLVAVWHAGEGEHGSLGYKPWYAINGGVHPRTLWNLWHCGAVRHDPSGSLKLAGGPADPPVAALLVSRAKLTAAGKRWLSAINKYNRNLPT